MALTIATRCRVIIDNDFAGDPDGLVALAHHLLSPGHRVDAVTSSRLSPVFGPPDGGAAAGAVYAAELAALIDGPVPEIAAGRDVPVDLAAVATGSEVSAAARTIIDQARREDDLPLTLVCGGPLTNVAEALAAAPDIAERLSLAWVGGSLADAEEYNRDTDAEAAAFVLGLPALEVRQFPLETYRRFAWSVAQIQDLLEECGELGAWLWRRFDELPLPPGFAVDAVWPLGDSAPLLGTALSGESSAWEAGERTLVCTAPDAALVLGDMAALFRRHAARG
ncbi:nucleoside hydrolase [Demequina phytophila]|uniref:nucleoside hydrolase n=1 Tax=Demequina phytophila TaxID=1638981 RepID=UPI0007861D26|nr:nucleoside hydrolase [Demequina phytophila]